jgi:hypothetical protein
VLSITDAAQQSIKGAKPPAKVEWQLTFSSNGGIGSIAEKS